MFDHLLQEVNVPLISFNDMRPGLKYEPFFTSHKLLKKLLKNMLCLFPQAERYLCQERRDQKVINILTALPATALHVTLYLNSATQLIDCNNKHVLPKFPEREN